MTRGCRPQALTMRQVVSNRIDAFLSHGLVDSLASVPRSDWACR